MFLFYRYLVPFYDFEIGSKQIHWYQAASIVYWAISDGIELPHPGEGWIARLYCCLEILPELGHATCLTEATLSGAFRQG